MNNTYINEYEEQANMFLERTGTTSKYDYMGTAYPNWDKNHLHYTFMVKFSRKGRTRLFPFYSSRMDFEKKNKTITAYTVLSCLQKYDVGSFENFCNDYGYKYETDEEYLEIKNTYNDVKNEYNKVLALWKDVLEDLQEIN